MSRRVPDWIEGYMAATSNSEPRDTYRRWVAISTVAAVLQRKCWLEWGTLIFYPNMYIVLVGPPAARKGTAMSDGQYYISRLGLPMSADETSRQALIKTLQGANASAQLSDGKIIHHSSLTVFSTELTVFMGYEDKDMLAALCDLFDCKDRFVKETISRGKEEIPNVWLNLLGATTPAQLQASVPQGFVGSGFTSRIVFVYEEDKARTVIKPSLSKAQQELRDNLLMDLGEIQNLCGPFSTDQAFENAYTIWRMHAEANPPFTDPRLEYYTQRRPLHIFKLCMIFSAARSDSRKITVADLKSAIETLEEAEEKMPSVFAGIGANPLAGVQHRIRKMLESQPELPLALLARTFESDASFTQLGEAIAALEQMGVCKLDAIRKCIIRRTPHEHHAKGSKPGLPAKDAGGPPGVRSRWDFDAALLHVEELRRTGEAVPEEPDKGGDPPAAAVPPG